MGERVPWNKIMADYPDQWVGFRDPEYNDDNTLKSVILTYVGKTKFEMADLQIKENGLYGEYTTPENLNYMNVGIVI